MLATATKFKWQTTIYVSIVAEKKHSFAKKQKVVGHVFI